LAKIKHTLRDGISLDCFMRPLFHNMWDPRVVREISYKTVSLNNFPEFRTLHYYVGNL